MFYAKSLANIFFIKNRTPSKPLPLLASNLEHIKAIAHLREIEQALAKDFWPGPLTLLCKAKDCVPEAITADTGKVAVRISSHKLAQELAHAVDAPLICSSANFSGFTPPAKASEIDIDLLKQVQGLILGETSPKGQLPSTIIEVAKDNKIYMRRHGAISKQMLEDKGWQIER